MRHEEPLETSLSAAGAALGSLLHASRIILLACKAWREMCLKWPILAAEQTFRQHQRSAAASGLTQWLCAGCSFVGLSGDPLLQSYPTWLRS